MGQWELDVGVIFIENTEEKKREKANRKGSKGLKPILKEYLLKGILWELRV